MRHERGCKPRHRETGFDPTFGELCIRTVTMKSYGGIEERKEVCLGGDQVTKT